MFRALLVLVTALRVVPAAHADPIIYATAATTGEVTSYCIRAGGVLDADPLQRINTIGNSPSRLILLQTQPDPAAPPLQFVYAAENDRVEVFQVGPGGRLSRQGRIPRQPVPSDPGSGLTAMNAHDIKIAQAADGSGPLLYTPERGDNRIAAFTLDPTTGLSTVPLQGFRCVGGSRDGIVCDPTVSGVCPSTEKSPATCSFVSVSDAPGSSCVEGPSPADWEDVLVANGVLFAARSTSLGEAIVYNLNPDGNFSNGLLVVNETIGSGTNPTQCAGKNCNQDNKVYPVNSLQCTVPVQLTDNQGQPIVNSAGSPVTRRAQIQPLSIRRRLNGIGSMILDGNILYVSERFRKAISGFQLCPNSFTPECTVTPTPGVSTDTCPAGGFFTSPKVNTQKKICIGDTNPGMACTADTQCGGLAGSCAHPCTNRFRQPRLAKKGGRTESDIRYNQLALAQGSDATTILGAQFNQGRVDGYRLRDGNLLPKGPTFRTKKDFRTSPFRMFVYRPPGLDPTESAGVLYVGSGSGDRVQAFQLNREGLPRDVNPFSETTVLTNTFPNDVLVVDLPGTCG
jgi:hypothetical protein